MQGSAYVIENKLREQMAKRKQGKGRIYDDGRRRLISTALPRSFDKHTLITEKDLKKLSGYRFKHPVISLYLTFTPDSTMRRKQVYKSEFNSMKHTFEHEHEDFVDKLSHDRRATLKKDFKEIEEYIREFVDAHETKTLVMFKSGGKLSVIYRLPILLEDRLVVNSMPYTLPLETLLEEEKKVLVIRAHKDEVSFYRYLVGDIIDLGHISEQTPADSVDKSIPNRIQRHRNTHLYRLAKQAAARLKDLAARGNYEALFFGGDNELITFIRENLPSHIQDLVTHEFSVSPETTKNDFVGAIQQELQKYEQEEEEEVLSQLSQYKMRGELISGIEQVLEAQNRFLVQKIVFDQQFEEPGYFCRTDSFFSMSAGSCPACSQPLTYIENIMEELLTVARNYNIEREVIHAKDQGMEDFQGIAAILRGNL